MAAPTTTQRSRAASRRRCARRPRPGSSAPPFDRRGPRACWTCRALRVGGQREHEHAAAVACASSIDRVDRAEAEVRTDRDRVDPQRTRPVEVRLGVRLRGRADVTPLDVEDHQRPGSPTLSDCRLQYGDSGRTESLEKCGLWLDRRDPAGERLDHGRAEPAQALDGVRQAPAAQQGGCGSIPTQSGPRVSMARISRSPKLSMLFLSRADDADVWMKPSCWMKAVVLDEVRGRDHRVHVMTRRPRRQVRQPGSASGCAGRG